MSNALHNRAVKKEDVKINPYTGEETEDLQSRLAQQLGPEYISTRPGAGGIKVSYIEGWKVINLANSIFGFNGWFSEVKTVQVDYLDERNGKFSVGISVIVRVTLKDGTFREDIGYGGLDNARTKAQAFEKAKKEAMTDALKRALRCFGNALGNCLYDKDFLSKVSTVKCAPPDFDESNLMRYTDNAPVSRAATIPPHPSAAFTNNHTRVNDSAASRPVTRTVTVQQQQQARTPGPSSRPQVVPANNTTNASSNKKSRARIDEDFDDSMTFSDDINLESEDFNDEVNELLNTKLKSTAAPGEEAEGPSEVEAQQVNDTPSKQQAGEIRPSQVSFVKARVAEDLQKNGNVASTHAFNPNFISPSIRRTLDPTKSTPVKRTAVNDLNTIRYDNPSLIPNRQIGKPKYPPPKRPRVDPGKENSNSTGEKDS